MDCIALRFAGPRHCDASARPVELDAIRSSPASCPPEPSSPSFRGRPATAASEETQDEGSVAAQLLGGVETSVGVWQEEVWRGVSDVQRVRCHVWPRSSVEHLVDLHRWVSLRKL